MNTQNNSMEYYESEGMRFMDEGKDDLARGNFEKAAELGSERAKVFLQYLDMNVSDEDFNDHAVKAEPFDYDLQPLFRVSRVRAVLRKAIQNVRNQAEAFIDGIMWGCRVAIIGKHVSHGIPM